MKKQEKSSIQLGLTRMINEIKKAKKSFLIIFVVAIFISLSDSGFKLFLGKTVDAIMVKNNTISFAKYDFDAVYFYLSLFFVSLFIDKLGSAFLWKYYAPLVRFKVFKSYILEVFSKIVTYPVSLFKEKGVGSITYTTTNGANVLSGALGDLSSLFIGPFAASFSLFFLFSISWQAGLLSLIIAVLFVLIFLFSKKKLSALEDKFNEKNKEIAEFATEKINLIFEIKKNNKEFIERQNFCENELKNIDESFYKKNIFDFKINLLRYCLYIVALGGSLALSVWLYKEGKITVGEIASIIMYVMYLNWNYEWMIYSISELVKNLTIIGDTEKLLLHTAENYTEGKKTKEIFGEIEFKNVDFEYLERENDKKKNDKKSEKKKFSLKNINLKIDSGQKVAFVGESGGGKSTSIDLIGGFYFPTKGEVFVEGISTKEWNLNHLRSSIAYVSQDISIFNTTLRDNISYGALRKVSQEEIEKAAKQANIDDFIKNLPDGYDTKAGEKGLKLSGGQKQRIAIARAVLRNPKILILDEPTSALDVKSETQIIESLKELMKNRTTVIIAHRLSTVRNADKIYVFKNGKIIEEGNYEELKKKNGEFAKMVELSDGLR